MSTTHVTSVTGFRTARGPCLVCGQRVQRTRRVVQTVNPFNRNTDGTVRTLGQVRACVKAELKKDS